MSIIAAIGAAFVTVAFVGVAVLVIEFIAEVRQEADWRRMTCFGH